MTLDRNLAGSSRVLFVVVMVTSIILGLLAGSALQEPALLHNTFDRGVEGWAVMQIAGAGAKVEATYDKAHLKNGPGSLDYNYKVGTGEVSVTALSVTPGKLAGMNSLHFWVQSDHATTIMVTVQEKDGGRYGANCRVPKNQWQEVQLSLTDFSPSTEADAPKDPDGKLDPDQINGVAVIDVDSFIAQNATFSEMLGITPGTRHLYLSDVQFLEAKLPNSFITGADGYKIDTFARPHQSWIGLGVNEMTVASDSPFAGKWLKVDYYISGGHVASIVHALQAPEMVGKKNLVFEAGCTRSCQLVVQLEQVNGAKFNTTIELPGKAESKAYSIPLSSLNISDDSPDKKAKFDPSQLKQIIFVDISGLTSGAEGDTTLYLSPITVKS